MNKMRLYLFSVACVFAASFALCEDSLEMGRHRGGKSGQKWSKESRGRKGGRQGGFGEERGFGRGGWKSNRGCWGDFLIVEKEDLREDVKEIWEKFEKLDEFKKDLWKEKKSQYKGGKKYQYKGGKKYQKKGKKSKSKMMDPKSRKEHFEKIDKKLQELDLSIEAVAKLRNLKGLSLMERFAINRMENRLIGMTLRKEGKGKWEKPEEEVKTPKVKSAVKSDEPEEKPKMRKKEKMD